MVVKELFRVSFGRQLGFGPIGNRQAFVWQVAQLGWHGMFEFDQEIVDVTRHADVAALASIVPFDVDTGKLVTCHVELHPMIFREEVQEMIEVFDTQVFNTKVIDNEAELDGLPFVAPETRSGSRFVVTFGLKAGAEEIVGQDACLGKTITSLANFKVDPTITILTSEIVFYNELSRYVRDLDADVFRVGHGSVEVEVLQAD